MLDLTPATLFARLFVLIFAFTFHELAHAWTADRFGDNTPRMQGRLTLNPLAHLDPIGSLLILVAGFGWARAVQVDPYVLRRRSQYAMMLVALAGPAANLVMASLAAILFRVFHLYPALDSPGIFPTLDHLATEFIFLNLILMLFNLIPLAPLDGEKIAIELFPPRFSQVLEQIRPISSWILILIVFAVPVVMNVIVYQPALTLFSLLTGWF